MSLRPLCGLTVLACVACSGAPATIEFVEVVPAQPRTNEIFTVKFKLADYRGVPQAGSLVTFGIEGETTGITLNPVMAMSLKGSGEVSTQLIATTPGAIVVTANGGSGKIAKSPPITVSGTGIPNHSQMTFQCGAIAGTASGGVHAIGAYDPARHLIAGVKVRCTAHLGDRNGDGVPNASVSFYTEAGTIEPTEATVTDVVGNATVLYKTSLPLPRETDPYAMGFQWNPDTSCAEGNKLRCNGEFLVPLWMEPYTWTTNPLSTLLMNNPMYDRNNLREPRRFDPIRRRPDQPTQMPVNNPRDNLVSMIAWTIGEEGFIDKNNNGNFDADEEPIDITEPFVDSNDNGTYDVDEKYVDTDKNGQWDGKNERWDPSTYIWRQERILWTGVPYEALYGINQPDDYTGAEPVVRRGQAGNPNAIIRCFKSAGYTLLIADPWWNAMARNGQSDGCSKQSVTMNVTVPEGALNGIAFTYPPIDGYSYTIVDALDRMPRPMTCPPQPGCYPPPYVPAPMVCDLSRTGSTTQDWEANLICKFTASPEGGHTITIPDQVSGTIYNSLPNVPP